MDIFLSVLNNIGPILGTKKLGNPKNVFGQAILV
jgi:hypothetical protein